MLFITRRQDWRLPPNSTRLLLVKQESYKGIIKITTGGKCRRQPKWNGIIWGQMNNFNLALSFVIKSARVQNRSLGENQKMDVLRVEHL